MTGALAIAACAVGTVGDKFFDDGSSDGGTGSDGRASGEGGAGSCSAPKLVCVSDAGSSCVDTTSDPLHCGSCATSCKTADAGALEAGRDDNPDSGVSISVADGGASEPWSLGAPSCATSACGVTCPAAMTECSDHICYDTQRFHEHCGDCNTACSAAQACTSGHCCAAGTAYCGSACVNVATDPNNCGSCGHTCGAAMACVAGTCTACATNEALTAAASTSGGGQDAYGYGPAAMHDGVLETTSCNKYTWVNASTSSGSEFLMYTWPAAKLLTKMHMDTSSATVSDSCGNVGRTMGAAQVQWWNGASWVTDGTVTGQQDDWDYTFTAPVTTTQVRLYAVYATNPGGSADTPLTFEWQVTGCN